MSDLAVAPIAARSSVQRAREDWQKVERAQAILDAAESLLVEKRNTVPTVEQVARRVGVAKGTVYLYFPTKEAIFLAMFQTRCFAWCEDVMTRVVAQGEGLTAESMVDAILAYPQANPIVLDLASYSAAHLQSDVQFDSVVAFKKGLNERLGAIGTVAETAVPDLADGHGYRALVMSYAYLLGLWQVAEPSLVMKASHQEHGADIFRFSFEERARLGLLAFWRRCTP